MDEIISIADAKQRVKEAYDYIWSEANASGMDAKVYMHWTASDYYTTFSDYHFCITGDGELHQTASLIEPIASTYMRNSGCVSFALCCAADAVAYDNGSCDLGNYPPTDAQLDTAYKLTCAIADALNLTIDLNRVMTHGEAADNEDGGYMHAPYAVWSDPQPDDGDVRWDLAVIRNGDDWRTGGDIIREYAQQLRDNGYLSDI